MKVNILYKLNYKPKRNGKDLIRCVLTVGKSSIEVATGLEVTPSDWDKKSQCILNDEPQNNLLTAFKAKINQVVSDFRLSSSDFTAKDIKEFLEGKNSLKITLLKAFEDYKDKYEDLEGIKYQSSTVVAWNTIFNRLKEFVLQEYSKNLLVSDIPNDFGHQFEVFLLKTKNLKKSTAMRTVKSIRGFFNDCIEKDYLTKNPLKNIIIRDDEDKIRAFLTWEELQKIIDYKPDCIRLEKAKDRFVFCCFTGLASTDYTNLQSENLKDYQGNLFLEGKRKKTKVKYRIPLRKEAKAILEKYGSLESLPKISTQKHADYVGEIADILCINKPIRRTHTARYTFAYLCRNVWNVDFASLALMMGHKNSQITEEIYTYTDNNFLSNNIQD